MNARLDAPQGSARWIWLRDDAPRRNQFARFERTFDLAAPPADFTLHLFADTRYRLWVNGAFVAAGPGRFVTQFPEYDSHPLAARLRPGANTIAVEVNFFGASSYQSMPDGEPGFIAWGGSADADLATPGAWRAVRCRAWRWDTPLFSFAQNPVEVCDTRLLDDAEPRAITLLDGAAEPWGPLRPYSGLPIPFALHRPRRIELAGRLAGGERRLGFMTRDPLEPLPADTPRGRCWTAFATWIRSPRDQTVDLSCFWSELQCNGHAAPVDTNTPKGNHGVARLTLHEGWNLLTGATQVLTEFWTYALGVPEAAGLSLHGRRDAACREPLAIAPAREGHGITLPAPSDAQAPAGWTLHNGDPASLTPSRMMAWDVPAADAVRGIEPGRLPEFSTIEADAATWCFSFAGEFLGHVVLEVEAPAGTVLDVACDDWQADHGGVALYRSHPFTDAADRFILRGGRQRIELFHPRGGKLIQATLRAPHGAAPLSLHDLYVRSRQTLGRDETRFSCDHAALEWVWPVAFRTLLVSTDESYSDCPWRERGCYLGDTYVNIHLDALLNADTRTARRALRTFAQAQRPDGQLACCAPAWLRKPHEDFSLIWLLALHDQWTFTGDTDLVEELWPTARRLWDSPRWERHASGLWNAEDRRLFIDWGVLTSEREGRANAGLNLFRLAASRACAALARATGRAEEASVFAGEAAEVDAALELLWNDGEGRLEAALGAHTPALHANILALAFGWSSGARRARILAYLEPRLRDNFARGIRSGQHSGHAELYFFHYLLPALARHGRPDLAELLIEQHYGFLKNLGDDTLAECFCRVEHAVGSRCHSWSGAPALYAARYVLGLRPAEPGNPRRLLCQPVVHGITRASGRIAHPLGWIEVDWEKKDGVIHPHIHAPPGVTIETGAARRRSEVVERWWSNGVME